MNRPVPEALINNRLAFTCNLLNGVHARPASQLAAALTPFAATVTLSKGDTNRADARSVLSVIGLDIERGDHCIIEALGDDAAAALQVAQAIIDNEWSRDDAPPAPALTRLVSQAPRTIRQSNARYVAATPASSGIGRGVCIMLQGMRLTQAQLDALPGPEEAELSAARTAFAATVAELRDRARASAHRFEQDLLNAHAQMAEDPALWTQVQQRVQAGVTAAQATFAAARHFMDHLRNAESAYLRDRAVDVQDVCSQVLARLSTQPSDDNLILDRDAIIFADVLTAHQLMMLDSRHVKGLVLASVGPTAHTVIIARSLGIPTLLNAREAFTTFAQGDDLILDSERGLLVEASTPPVQRFYTQQLCARERRHQYLAPALQGPAHTRDGHRLEVGVNASTAEEVLSGVRNGAEGVGLLRTELLFLDRSAAPSEDEQFDAYAAVIRAAQGRPVIIRTFDIGGDKPAPYLNLPREDNPFLGNRGLRLYPGHPALLTTQLRAICRASSLGSMKLMAPMVSIPSEAAWFREQVVAVQQSLAASNIAFDPAMPIGVMLEVPSLALAIDELRPHVDFLSIGTNDLCQYWMAVDRGNHAVAALYNPLQPSFLRLLAAIAAAAKVMGLWLGVCGEMAGRRSNLPLFVGLCVDEISAAPSEALALKASLATLDAAACRDLLARALACRSAAEVEGVLAANSACMSAPASILDTAAINLASSAADKDEAIRDAVDLLYIIGRTEAPDAVEDAVWAREDTYSTGLGFGFAIPHCKSDAVTSPTLSVLKLASPIDWGSSDEKPVTMVLLLAVPASDTTGAHMRTFAKLARKLMHEDFRTQLVACDTPAAIELLLRTQLQLD